MKYSDRKIEMDTNEEGITDNNIEDGNKKDGNIKDNNINDSNINNGIINNSNTKEIIEESNNIVELLNLKARKTTMV